MKKSMLYTGMGYFLFGMTCIAFAVFYEFEFEGILWGVGGAGTGPGIMMIWKYLYWSQPGKPEEYHERSRIERIERNDERKIMLRNKSGNIIQRFMIGVYCVLIGVFSVMTSMGHMMPWSKYMVMALSALMIFQIVAGVVVFNALNKRL